MFDGGGRSGHTRDCLVSLQRPTSILPGGSGLDLATNAREAIHVPSVCLVELTYLIEKGRLPSAARERLIEALDDPTTAFRLAPLDRAVADALAFIDRREVPDLPDRVVAATAIALQVLLISRDGKIRTSSVQTVW